MFKWIYQMGAAHENERIRRLVAEFTINTDAETQWLEANLVDKKANWPTNKKRLSELMAARNILNKLMSPQYLGRQEFGPAPIDREKS